MTNYSKTEWEFISTIPQYIGLLMSTAEYSGIEGSIEELKAGVQSIADAKAKYPDNTLIQAMLPNGNVVEDILNDIKEQQDYIIKQNNVSDKKDLSNFQDLIFDRLRKVQHYVSNEEKSLVVKQFNEWLLDIAEKVAVAAIENTVFGQTADPFCKKEREMYEKIKKVLK